MTRSVVRLALRLWNCQALFTSDTPVRETEESGSGTATHCDEGVDEGNEAAGAGEMDRMGVHGSMGRQVAGRAV